MAQSDHQPSFNVSTLNYAVILKNSKMPLFDGKKIKNDDD